MHDIHLYLKRLNDYFDVNRTTPEQLQSLLRSPNKSIDFDSLLNQLTEIANECRQTRQSDIFDNTHDSWEYYSKIISIKHLVAFFSALIDLTLKNKNVTHTHKRVSLAISQTYVLLLTSPGAKIFDAFEPDVLRKIFKMFDFVKNVNSLREHERILIQMQLITLLEDFQLYLKHVSFEEYEDLQLQFIEAIASIMEYHHLNGFNSKYSFQIHELCYSSLENVCLPIHGSEITSSLLMVLNGTAALTRYHRPCSGFSSKPKYPLITDWFIEMLKHYPRQTCETLNCYIQSILTDTDLVNNRETLNRYLDICAHYDAAMVRQCGESINEFLIQIASSKESQHRTNCVELISRMIINDTECNWELFRSELPKLPREIKLIRILLQKMYDSNNVVALKAINAFLRITNEGNKISKEALKKCFDEIQRKAIEDETVTSDCEADMSDAEGETQSEMPLNLLQEPQPYDYTRTNEFKELLVEIRNNLMPAIKLQLRNNSALVRRAIILLLEYVATTTLKMDSVLQSYDLRQLYIDQSTLVRKQLVLSLDRILNCRPTSEAAILAWIKIVLDLANDTDAKVMETVMESFKRNIFDKIQNYEKSSSLTHVFPWRLLKNMLNCTDSPDFRISIQKWMNKNLLTAKTLTKIETHLDTSNATEAWILLAMVAPNIQGHNPERVSKLLLQNLKYDMTNTVENCYIQLEVLSFWLKYLNNPSKNEIKRLMTEMLATGSLRPRNINRAFGICYKLSTKSGDRERDEFISDIRNSCENYIQLNRNSMFIPNLCDDRLISYLYLYSEVSSILESTLHSEIVDFFFIFLQTAADGQMLTVRNDCMLPEKVNCIISVLTGMSSFSPDICTRFVPLLGRTLRTVEHTKVSFTAIKCLGYLCKKNTAVVETVVPYILLKTQHRYSTVREFALKTLATLILEDYLKFRGSLLIYVLAAMLDSQREIKELAIELIMKYTLEKNDIFLRTCLLECPFAFNGMPCFGQSLSSVSKSGNILKGKDKQPAREFIYRYMIRKVESVHLYMYLGNMTRLLDHIEKERTLLDQPDMQAAIVDFLYVCSEICVANEKQKKSFAKHTKDNQDGLEDGEPLLANTENNAEEETSGKGRKGKKNAPTISQALAMIEKIVPQIVSIDEQLRTINSSIFGPAIDRLCAEMCGHFEQIFEFAQPQSFWSKYRKGEKKLLPGTSPSTRQTKKQLLTRKAETCSSDMPPTRSRKINENDSGQFTMEDDLGSRKSGQSRSTSSRSTKNRQKKHAGSDYDSDSENDAVSICSRSTNGSRSSTTSNRIKTKRKSIGTPSSRKSVRHR